MKSASNTVINALPEFAPNDVTAGIDWARDHHAVAIVDGRGRQIHRCTVEHTTAGPRELVAVLGKHGVGEVAIERPHAPVVDTLLTAEITVMVIPPNQVKNLRGHYGWAGNKDDRFDAYVRADTLRTDRARLRALLPGREDTVALRRTCRALARAWLHVIWQCWQDGVAYDPAQHRALNRVGAAQTEMA